MANTNYRIYNVIADGENIGEYACPVFDAETHKLGVRSYIRESVRVEKGAKAVTVKRREGQATQVSTNKAALVKAGVTVLDKPGTRTTKKLAKARKERFEKVTVNQGITPIATIDLSNLDKLSETELKTVIAALVAD